MPPTAADLPGAVTDRAQWLCWRPKQRDGKQTKVPVDPATRQIDSATDPDTWTSFETARRAATDSDLGLGFAFSADDPLVGVDLDDCRDPETGDLADWASDLVATLDSYTEVSPSGTGVHVLVEGSLPPGRNRRGDVEMYETDRFFTVTGDHVADTPRDIHARTEALATVYEETLAPDEPESSTSQTVDTAASTAATESEGVDLSDEDLLERAQAAANGAKFRRLWNGSTSGYASHSEADMALCSLLAFWTGGDEQRVDRLFRQSDLLREKWDEQHYADGRTYGEVTVRRAVAGTDEVYTPADTESSERSGADDTPEETASAPAAESAASDQSSAELIARIESLNQQVRELSAENERLREELAAARTAGDGNQNMDDRSETQSAGVWPRLRRLLSLNGSG